MNIGVDLIKSERIKNIKHPEKIFTTNELTYLETHRSVDTKAGMYAAKEALLKTLKCGLEGYSFLEIEVLHNNPGTPYPYFNFYGKLKKEIEENHYKFDLSISHDGDYAIATVIRYKDND